MDDILVTETSIENLSLEIEVSRVCPHEEMAN
jgi:hypothetical protein